MSVLGRAWLRTLRHDNFFNPPAHLCAVTYVTEISMHVTLSSQSHSHSLFPNLTLLQNLELLLKTERNQRVYTMGVACE